MIRFLQTPSKLKKIVLGGILLVICGAMVVTLVPGGILGDAFGYGAPSGNVLAKVGDQEITVYDVQQMARNLGRQMFQRGYPQSFMPFLLQRAADNLITQRAMLTEARRLGFKVTDQELADELRHGPYAPYLFPNGQFVGTAAYESFVQNNANMSVAQFEQLMKDDLVIRKLRAAVEGGISVSDAEILQEFKRENTKVKLEYAVLSLDDVMRRIKPTDSELQAYYESHKASYVNAIPERRRARYVVIASNKLRQQVQVTPDDLRRYYNDHQDQYRVPEQVDVRHILIKMPPPGPDGKVDEKAVEAARQKAESILKQLQGGADFATLAKKYSEDPGSASNGGSLGWIQRGRTVAEFEKVAFSLAKGQTSGLVRTSFGFHIIRVDDKQEAHLKTLDEVKAEITPIIAADKAAAQADNLARRVENQARTAGLEKAAKDNGLEVITSGLFGHNDSLPGLGVSPDFMSAVFNARVSGPPESVHTAQGYVIYQVTEVKPAATPSFEEIRARVEQEFKADRAQQLLAQKTQELSDRARAEHDLKKAAKELGATVKTSELVSLESQVPDLGAMSGPGAVAFDMNKGEISGPLPTGRTGVVLTVVEKQEPAESALADSQERIRETLLERKRNSYIEVFAANLRQQMEKEGKIRVNTEELKRLTTPTSEPGA